MEGFLVAVYRELGNKSKWIVKSTLVIGFMSIGIGIPIFALYVASWFHSPVTYRSISRIFPSMTTDSNWRRQSSAWRQPKVVTLRPMTKAATLSFHL